MQALSRTPEVSHPSSSTMVDQQELSAVETSLSEESKLTQLAKRVDHLISSTKDPTDVKETLHRAIILELQERFKKAPAHCAEWIENLRRFNILSKFFSSLIESVAQKMLQEQQISKTECEFFKICGIFDVIDGGPFSHQKWSIGHGYTFSNPNHTEGIPLGTTSIETREGLKEIRVTTSFNRKSGLRLKIGLIHHKYKSLGCDKEIANAGISWEGFAHHMILGINYDTPPLSDIDNLLESTEYDYCPYLTLLTRIAAEIFDGIRVPNLATLSIKLEDGIIGQIKNMLKRRLSGQPFTDFLKYLLPGGRIEMMKLGHLYYLSFSKKEVKHLLSKPFLARNPDGTIFPNSLPFN